MVLKKKPDNRSIGFQVSIIPRAPRSARRWALSRKTADKHVCAIELLASLAGKLLQETESSASNHASEEDNQLTHFKDVFIIKKTLTKDKPSKVKEQENCEGSTVVSEHSLEESKQEDPLKRSVEVESDHHWECSSTFVGSPHLVKENRDAKSIIISSSEISNKVESFLKNEVSHPERQLSDDHQEAGGIAMVNYSSCLLRSEGKSAVVPALPSLDFRGQKLFHNDQSPKSTFSTWQNNGAKLCSRDDTDEKFSTFSKSSTKSFRHPKRALDRKIRKLLASKHWKVAPQLKDYESLENDGGRRSFNHKRGISHKCKRYHRDFLCKRRKLLDGGLVMTSFLNSEIATSSDHKDKNYDLGGSFTKTCGEIGISSSVLGSQASFGVKNAHVKFSIKSFRIPELLIDVPETATVGSLKRTIVEAVSTILGEGLCVGVMLHGKKVRDDNRTLLQSGISGEDNLDSLGFLLEPNLTQFIATSTSEHKNTTPLESGPELVTSTRCASTTAAVVDTTMVSDSPSNNNNPVNNNNNARNMINNVCKNHEQPIIMPSDSDDLLLTDNKPTSDSKALVPVVSDTHHHPLPLAAVIPVVSQKIKRLEFSQRRMRRPFSVTEVEALVEAVEQLGTGRWRDVKLRSFENADHRTYVDLKDKWKTLVHTASISTQQRRGEPVPQELLDRVMAAHLYWSQQQGKQQLQPATLRIAHVPASSCN